MENDKIRILIADDMEAHRRRLERFITRENEMILIDSVESGYQAVACAVKEKPDVILMDIEMENNMAGINAATEIHKTVPEAKIIILTVHHDNSFVFAAFQTGIVDYMIKSASKEEIMDAIRSAADNRSPIRPIIAEKIREEFKRIKRSEASLTQVFNIIATLTPAELEILKMLCDGKKRKHIAEERSVELETIKKQISGILKKFNKRTTREVIRMMNEVEFFELMNKIS
ncbi:response regulator transcription factor [Chengkuizengella axinellae]|uniref:Response regulator transcription factor n=1 Tax=Chengkuizengella axinellae TaxID=3064388 RepID=A0ABT9J028_9BACL|nr:response regulator transcription factor [Chengkuizengella sp. 2205SS18-9]MDP5274828.1 response regulator transcription factor [Chengkuizengella sp. 2205SS18-9]